MDKTNFSKKAGLLMAGYLIPYAVLNLNKNLKQNQGYTK